MDNNSSISGDQKGKRVVCDQMQENSANKSCDEQNSTKVGDLIRQFQQAHYKSSVIKHQLQRTCQQGGLQSQPAPLDRPERIKRVQFAIPNNMLQQRCPVGEASSVQEFSSDTTMSSHRTPLEQEDANVISDLLSNLGLAEQDTAEMAVDVDVQTSWFDVQRTCVQPARQNESRDAAEGQYSGTSALNTQNMQTGHVSNMSIGMQSRSDVSQVTQSDDMMLGGIPHVISRSHTADRSRDHSMNSNVQQLVQQFDDPMQHAVLTASLDEFVDANDSVDAMYDDPSVFDVDRLNDYADVPAQVQQQALQSQLQIVQMQNDMLRQQNQQQSREQQMQFQLQQQQLENERLLRESQQQQHELFIFRQMQDDQLSVSQSENVSPGVAAPVLSVDVGQNSRSMYVPSSSTNVVRNSDVVQGVVQGVVQSVVQSNLVQVPRLQQQQRLRSPIAEATGAAVASQQQQQQHTQPRQQGGVVRPTLIPQSVKLEKPGTFSGKNYELQNWLFEMKSYIDGVNLGSYGNACRFIASHFKGQAQTWWRMYCVDQQVSGTASIYDTIDVDTLLNDLESQFSDTDKEVKLRDRILKIEQRGSVQDYTAQFKSLQIELGSGRLDDATAFHVYQNGLQSHIRLAVMMRDPVTVSDLMLSAERYYRAHALYGNQRNVQNTFGNRDRSGFSNQNSGRDNRNKSNNFRGGNNNRNNSRNGDFQYKSPSTNRNNPNSYQNVSQYSNSSYRGSSPMVVNNAQNDGQQQNRVRFGNNSGVIKCHHCNQPGHIKRQCYKYQRENNLPVGQQPSNKGKQSLNMAQLQQRLQQSNVEQQTILNTIANMSNQPSSSGQVSQNVPQYQQSSQNDAWKYNPKPSKN